VNVDAPIRALSLKQVNLPFKVAFKHASATRTATESLWVEAQTAEGITGYGEGCPRSYVSGETLASARQFFEQYSQEIVAEVKDLPSLTYWVESHRNTIDANPAAWCAIELALIDCLARQTRQSVEAFLGLAEIRGAFQYSAVLGDMNIDALAKLYARYKNMGLADYKLKLSGDLKRDRQKLELLAEQPPQGFRLRLDANNLWENDDQAIDSLQQLGSDYFAVEEPLTANRYDDLLKIHRKLDTRIILDESFLNMRQFEFVKGDPRAWIINVRVSKMGGLLRSIEIVREAVRLGTPVIVGAQVGETSLLTRAALPVATVAGEQCLAQEGAYGTYLLESDICEPALMFGRNGVLAVEDIGLGPGGFGIDPLKSADFLVPL